MAVCEAQLSDPDGLAKFRTFFRRFVRKGGDVDKLCEDLTFGVQDDPDCLKRFFDGDEDFTTISSLLSSADQEAKVRWMNVLNASIHWIQDEDPTAADDG